MGRKIAVVAVALLACPPLPHSSTAQHGESTTAASTGPDTGGTGPVTVPCESDADCPDRCLDGRCVEGCSAEAPCPKGLVCTDDACVAPLPAPPPCPGSVSVERLLEVALPEGQAQTLGAADVDGDGAPELFAGRGRLWQVRLDDLVPVQVVGGDMVGRFETNVGDVDGDGHVDLLPRTGDIILFGDGAGQFNEAPGPDPALVDGALGDLNGDGRADIVGFMYTCPLDQPPDAECSGETPARWIRGDDGWQRSAQGTIFGWPKNVLVAPLLAGDQPIGVYETDMGWILLGTFGPESWEVESFRVSHIYDFERTQLLAVRRGGDDRAELLRVAARKHQWTWGARLRETGPGHVEVPDRWALPGFYPHVAAGDVDQDGADDVVLAGPSTLLLLDREEEPTGACVLDIPVDAGASALALADLDGDETPELLVGEKPGLVAYTLRWSP